MAEEAKTTEQTEANPAKVELDAEVYSAMLDRLDELEAAQNKSGQEQGGDDLDSLAREAQPSPPKPSGQVDLERLNNSGLANYIARELTSDVINPMLVKLSQIELRLEEKELSTQFEDFKDVKREAYAILHKNPSLSLEQSYHLAKTQKAKSEKPKAEEREETTSAKGDKLRHLPPRPTIHGEKPSGAVSSATHAARSYPSNRGAAERAIEDMKIDFPVKGGNI